MATGTYTDTLLTDRDKVRFLVRDVTGPDYIISDNEIDGLLILETSQGEAKPYYVAATILETRSSEFLLAGAKDGFMEKETPELRVKTGGLDARQEILQQRIRDLRIQGASKDSRGKGLISAFGA